MKRILAVVLSVLFASMTSYGQESRTGNLALNVSSHTNLGQITDGKTTDVEIPDGTQIEIESPFTLSSMHFKPKDVISFRVVNPVRINGLIVIHQGATVTGRIVKAKRGGHFGKAGFFSWTIESVTAADGSQVALRPMPLRQRGDSKSAKVATKMVVTGVLLPWIAPVALLHGFKRGGDAYIPAGKRFEVFVHGQTKVKVAENPG
jgi:hypothetical protein